MSWDMVHSGANPSRLNGKWKAFKVSGVLAILVKEERTANLVAAAPDLLEGLKHMRYRNHDVSVGCDACVRAVAAIRKAEPGEGHETA